MRRVLPLVLLAGCFVSKAMPAEEACEQATSRYSQRWLTCTEDPDLAMAKTHDLEKAHSCAITGWSQDTGWVLQRYLELKGDQRVSFDLAWACSEALAAQPCDTVTAADPASDWLYTVSQGCIAIFDGPGDPGSWVDTGLWSY